MAVLAADKQILIEERAGGSVISTSEQKKLYLMAKRLLDIVVASVGLTVMFLPMVLIFVLIRLESPGSAVYIHHRIGKNGEPLPLLKFRSMRADAEKDGGSFFVEGKFSGFFLRIVRAERIDE